MGETAKHFDKNRIPDLLHMDDLKIEPNFLQLKSALQSYQLNRIKNTYSDFSNSSEFKELTSFFFNQIYGPQDFGFRNDSIKTLFNKSHPFLRKDIVKAVENVIELNDLSDEMDELLTKQLLKLGIYDLDSEVYAVAYKKCDNYKQRCYQIELMINATQQVFKLSHVWMIGASLTALHSFTELLGIGKIMNFLYDGYQAFHKVSDIKPFTDAIFQKENELNNSLFSMGNPAK
ncbi:MAG: hypothetical protein D8M58_05885 [Calditrichaeota bacterium]|nr:MAG: hypothetical protein DWQ03_20620 [Calditrichota bacterium]MBL1204908.1 hypothetical protein [Calditrichota bacterium]